MGDAIRQFVATYGTLRRYEFINLTDDLQDEILDLLDTSRLTFKEAEKMCSKRNVDISGESIRRFYNALRLERQKSEIRNAWLRAADMLKELGAEKMFECFISYMMGPLISGVESGTIDFPIKDFMKLLRDIPEGFQRLQGTQANGNEKKEPTDIIPETKKKVREELYGL